MWRGFQSQLNYIEAGKLLMRLLPSDDAQYIVQSNFTCQCSAQNNVTEERHIMTNQYIVTNRYTSLL